MNKYDLALDRPLMNTAGMLGFSPEPRGPVDLSQLGAFVTHPVSLALRSPAHGTRLAATPGGFLLHTGYPNPGMKQVLRAHASRWRSARLPVVVHLLATQPEEARRMAARLEGLENILAIELGLPAEIAKGEALAFAAAASGEIPVILRLPLERAIDLAQALQAEIAAGRLAVAAISLGPPRGAFPLPGGAILRGRLYGPAVFPLALATVQALTPLGLPVIAAGGVFTTAQADAMLAAGAVAVQLDSVLWRGYP